MGDSNTLVRAHLPCPNCGSSDALSEYSDGHTHCFSCQTTIHVDETINKDKMVTADTIDALPKRGINRSTCMKYQYGKGMYSGKHVQIANYYDEYGTLKGQKLRFPDKTFCTIGKIGTTFFGQHLFSNGKRLIVTEGEIDCLTVSQMYANNTPVVSIPSGAGGAKKVFQANLKWLNEFDEVIVIFDNDEAGQKAMKDIEGILPSEKLKLVSLTMHKDPNEYYLANDGVALMDAIENARKVMPEGIINGSELWETLENEPESVEGYSLPWNIEAQDMIKGIRKGEILLLTAGTGTGKSTLAREIMYDIAMRHKCKVGVMMLEENVSRTAKGIMGIHVGKRLHISRTCVSQSEYKQAFDETLGTGRFILYNHFGSLAGNKLLNAMRYMAVSEHCDFLILDHISIAVSGVETNDERKMIDVLMTKLRSLCEETGVGMVAICHLKRTDDARSHEEGAIISMNHLRGSQSLAQLSDTIIALERNQQAEDGSKNQLKVRVLKCRFTGETGLGGTLTFDKETNRLKTLDPIDTEDTDEEEEEPKEF